MPEKFINDSEQLTYSYALSIFLNEFTKYSVKYDDNGVEHELCDCLLEFQDTYFAIQIKERKKDKIGIGDEKWFKKHVIENAINQCANAIKILKEPQDIIFKKDGKIFKLDKKKYILPIIVFQDSAIKNYPRVYDSKRLGFSINIFELNDFKQCLKTLFIPFEISEYLNFRLKVCKSDESIFDKNFVVSDTEKGLIVLEGGVNSEKELAEFYYIRTYFNKNITIEKLTTYNEIVNAVIKNAPDQNCKGILSHMFCAVDVNRAITIVDQWLNKLQDSLETKYKNAYTYDLDDSIIFLLAKPLNIDIKTFKVQVMNRTSDIIRDSNYNNAVQIICYIEGQCKIMMSVSVYYKN